MINIQNQVRREIWNEIADIKQKAQQIRNSGIIGGEVIPENSPVGESASNGFIENGIEEVQNQ